MGILILGMLLNTVKILVNGYKFCCFFYHNNRAILYNHEQAYYYIG